MPGDEVAVLLLYHTRCSDYLVMSRGLVWESSATGSPDSRPDQHGVSPASASSDPDAGHGTARCTRVGASLRRLQQPQPALDQGLRRSALRHSGCRPAPRHSGGQISALGVAQGRVRQFAPSAARVNGCGHRATRVDVLHVRSRGQRCPGRSARDRNRCRLPVALVLSASA